MKFIQYKDNAPINLEMVRSYGMVHESVNRADDPKQDRISFTDASGNIIAKWNFGRRSSGNNGYGIEIQKAMKMLNKVVGVIRIDGDHTEEHNL